jgi:1-acyl-sn-glycerol-3-phosphate acyltransferase
MSARAERVRTELVVHARPVYTAVRTYLVGHLGLVHRFRAEGRENLPATGGVLIVANHASYMDIPAIAVAAPRHVAFVARASLDRVPGLSWLMRQAGCVLVQRNSADRAALEAMIAHLEQGDCVAIFPEGTRSSDGSLGPFRAGASVAARRAGVPIVPAAVLGTFAALPRGALVPRPGRISVRFGAPIPGAEEGALERARAAILALGVSAGSRGDSGPMSS